MPIENAGLGWWQWALLIPSLAACAATLRRWLLPEVGLAPARWTALELFLVIFLHIFASIGVSLAIRIPFLPFIIAVAGALIISNAITCLVVLGVAWRSGSLAALGLFPPRKPRNLAAVAAAWLTFLIPLAAAYWAWILALSALGLKPELQPVLSLYLEARARRDAAGMALFGFGAVVMAPLAEELLFRGFLFGFLRSRFGAPIALASTSALFALFHPQPEVFLPIFLVGAVLNWIYIRTGSLAHPIIFHALFNGGTLVGL